MVQALRTNTPAPVPAARALASLALGLVACQLVKHLAFRLAVLPKGMRCGPNAVVVIRERISAHTGDLKTPTIILASWVF